MRSKMEGSKESGGVKGVETKDDCFHGGNSLNTKDTKYTKEIQGVIKGFPFVSLCALREAPCGLCLIVFLFLRLVAFIGAGFAAQAGKGLADLAREDQQHARNGRQSNSQRLEERPAGIWVNVHDCLLLLFPGFAILFSWVGSPVLTGKIF